MGSIVGSSSSVSTWGKFRCAWCLESNYDYLVYDFTIEYYSGQKSAATGSGLIRWPRGVQSISDQQPTILSAMRSGNYTFFMVPTDPTFPGTAATTEFKNEMIGELVAVTGTSYALTSTFFDTGSQNTGSTTPLDPITSIGKLTAF
jgi:hypothetical protein